MTAITVGRATATVPATPAKSTPVKSTSTKSGSGFFARAWKAFMESRMKQAEREIALRRHLLPSELQDFGEQLARSEKDLPFVR